MSFNHKSIVFFLKSAVAITVIYYIYSKMAKYEDLDAVIFNTTLAIKNNLWFLIITFLLMPLNWLIESLKWKLICNDLQKITYINAISGVLAGVAFSVFTPNRVGEFAGKILTLKNENRIKGTTLSFLSGFYQLLITVLFALLAFIILFFENKSFFTALDNYFYYAIAITVVLLFILLFFLNSRFEHIKKKWYAEIASAILLAKSQSRKLFVLSLARYLVFSVQFYLLFSALEISFTITESLIIIPLTFFISTLIPSFLFTEALTRGAVSSILCSLIFVGYSCELAAISYFMLWIINIAIPAIIGIVFFYKLKIDNK